MRRLAWSLRLIGTMIKFAQPGADDTWVVFLGITVENLDRIANKLEPIVFPAEQVGLGAGSFAIGTGGMGAALRAQLGAKELRSCVELTQADADVLVSGGLVERSLESLGFARKGTVLLLLGKTETQLVEALRAAGLITPSTRMSELPSAAAPQPRVRTTKRINVSLVLSGLLFVGLGGLGVEIGKAPALGVLIALGGVAVGIWGFMYTPPHHRV